MDEFDLHNHDGENSLKVDFNNLIPIRLFTDNNGNNKVPTTINSKVVAQPARFYLTDTNILSNTMVIVKDPAPSIISIGTGTISQQIYRMYVFIDGDWQDLTDI